ncbi:DUF1236 domain-containing protein [Pseudolabrys sp. FHR47]|uniref:DUF1236 domain-containing protein n=1 Tax=Pseudolabrys sp. FHR47 TaxID=2562284 RepID=UPI001FF05360|nr:DUF1236 domain-containing protein [Pseudolabrys sp. FHR47]
MTQARLLTTAALALVIGAGATYAQTNQASPERAPAAQQSAPPAKVAPSMNAGEGKRGMPETTGQGSPQRLSPGSGENTNIKDMKAQPPQRSGAAPESGVKDDKAGMNAGKSGAETKSGATARDTQSSTTGQGSAGARANLTTEQRTKITSVIKRQKVEPVNLNISISVGTRVPEHVRYYPLPAEVVTIYPQWRGFDYIIVGSTIVVIDPGTREIVAVLEA